MIARYASAATSGAIITFGLLLSMQALIALQPGAESEQRVRGILSLVPVRKEKPLVQKRDQPVNRKDLSDPIQPPVRPKQSTNHPTINVPRAVPLPPPPTSQSPIGVMTDGPLVALVRVEPTYPARAQAQGIEGFVIVRFDVTTDGRVSNAAVVESSHAIFESAAVKAAERFKFKPRIVDGIALETYGIRNVFRFELDQ